MNAIPVFPPPMGDVMPPEIKGVRPKKRQAHVHKTAEPVFLNQLVDKIGSYKKTGELIGISDAAVGDYCRKGKAPYNIEMLAEQLMKPEMAAQVTAVVTAPPEVIEVMTTWVKSYGGSITKHKA